MNVEALGDLTPIAAMCVGTYGLPLARLRQTNHIHGNLLALL